MEKEGVLGKNGREQKISFLATDLLQKLERVQHGMPLTSCFNAPELKVINIARETPIDTLKKIILETIKLARQPEDRLKDSDDKNDQMFALMIIGKLSVNDENAVIQIIELIKEPYWQVILWSVIAAELYCHRSVSKGRDAFENVLLALNNVKSGDPQFYQSALCLAISGAITIGKYPEAEKLIKLITDPNNAELAKKLLADNRKS